MRHLESKSRTLLRSTRTSAICIAVIAAISGGQEIPRAYAHLARPKGAQRTPEQAARLMAQIGNSYQGPCTAGAYPNFRDRAIPQAGAKGDIHRKVWQGTVDASGQLLELVLNDQTGKLMCAFNAGDSGAPSENSDISAPIDTPNQAARISIAAARKLLSIPAGAQAALDGEPHHTAQSSYWRVAWRVRYAPGARTYPVVVTLNHKDGKLISIANGAELDRTIAR